ncbi:hypothetical protein HAX54_027353, partial [Datura stramonium]|nr:hypothetical protein [Datura stramonium]
METLIHFSKLTVEKARDSRRISSEGMGLQEVGEKESFTMSCAWERGSVFGYCSVCWEKCRGLGENREMNW